MHTGIKDGDLSYKANFEAHFDCLYRAVERYQKRENTQVTYGQTRKSGHYVWLCNGCGDQPRIKLDFNELVAVKSREELVSLWDLAYINLMLAGEE